MPEGPELHLASVFVNTVCAGVMFTGAVEKSEVSKGAEVPFASDAYRISATARGKEVRLTLTPAKTDPRREAKVVQKFKKDGTATISQRRPGCPRKLKENVLSNLLDKAFDRPVCEALLNQKYFNGIGNYLRAEILYRLKIPPFVKARTVLEGLKPKHEETVKVKEEPSTEAAEKADVDEKKTDSPDLLSLCHTVPLEVVNLGGKGYDPEKKDDTEFISWLQCYSVDGMKSVTDHNGRTMWFKGDPGPMAPKASKSPKAKRKIKKEVYTDKKVKLVKKEPGAGKREMDVCKKQSGTRRQNANKTGLKAEAAENNRRTKPRRKSSLTGLRQTRAKSSRTSVRKAKTSAKATSRPHRKRSRTA